jgi:hypothetical protein
MPTEIPVSVDAISGTTIMIPIITIRIRSHKFMSGVSQYPLIPPAINAQPTSKSGLQQSFLPCAQQQHFRFVNKNEGNYKNNHSISNAVHPVFHWLPPDIPAAVKDAIQTGGVIWAIIPK